MLAGCVEQGLDLRLSPWADALSRGRAAAPDFWTQATRFAGVRPTPCLVGCNVRAQEPEIGHLMLLVEGAPARYIVPQRRECVCESGCPSARLFGATSTCRKRHGRWLRLCFGRRFL